MTLRYGRYEAVCKLGEGAMAAVHLARDPVLARFVAVKVLHRSVAAGKVPLQRFFNEAKTVARLPNPHVVEVFDFGKQGRDYYLVMEFVDGSSLQGMLGQSGPGKGQGQGLDVEVSVTGPSPKAHPGRPLPDEVTASLLCQAAEGLEMAARHGVVHRDIKPENLIINSQGYLKIADFGIAHLQDDSLTRTGVVLGSPLYMSPEQVRGAKPITSQSDMFSLGAVLYRCLAGSPPFASSSLKGLYRKIAQEAPAPLRLARPDLDPALAGLVETLLQKDPTRRGGGPRWLRSELRAWLFSRGVSDPMERVSLHMRDLAERGVQAPWKQEMEDLLPRTVLSSAPLAVEETVRAYGAASTVRNPSRSREQAQPTSAPRRETWEIREAGFGWRLLAGAGLVAVMLGGGAFLGGRFLIPERPEAGGGEQGGYPIPPQGTGTEGQGEEAASGPGAATGFGTVSNSGRDSGGLAHAVDPQGDASPVLEPSAPTAVEVRAQDPASITGSLLVQSAPPFAQVFLDGHAAGVTPVTLGKLSLGAHRILVRSRGGKQLDTLLQVQAGQRVLRVRLEPEAVALENDE